MISRVFAAVTKDLAIVARLPGFFDLSSEQRRKQAVAGLHEAYPAPCLEYLSHVSSEDFMADVLALLPMLQTGRMPTAGLLHRHPAGRIDQGLHLKARLLEEKLQVRAPLPSESFLDDLEHYLLSFLPKRMESASNDLARSVLRALSESIAGFCDKGVLPTGLERTELGRQLRQLFTEQSAGLLLKSASECVLAELGIRSATVQSSIALDPALKESLRQRLLQETPGSIPLFVVESSLLGGIRIFSQGVLQDFSWSSLVSRLTASTS